MCPRWWNMTHTTLMSMQSGSNVCRRGYWGTYPKGNKKCNVYTTLINYHYHLCVSCSTFFGFCFFMFELWCDCDLEMPCLLENGITAFFVLKLEDDMNIGKRFSNFLMECITFVYYYYWSSSERFWERERERFLIL